MRRIHSAAPASESNFRADCHGCCPAQNSRVSWNIPWEQSSAASRHAWRPKGFFATGIRVAELAGLRDDDIDLTAGVIKIIGKGSLQRRVYVPDSEIRELIVAYRHARDTGERTTKSFLINSRGEAASPQYIRRLVRQLGENAA